MSTIDSIGGGGGGGSGSGSGSAGIIPTTSPPNLINQQSLIIHQPSSTTQNQFHQHHHQQQHHHQHHHHHHQHQHQHHRSIIGNTNNQNIIIPQYQRKKDQALSSKSRLKKLAYGPNYIPEEETIRNDYSLHYVLTGLRPQNHIQNTSLENRFAEYPKLKKLLQLKHSLVQTNSHQPTYLTADLRPGRPDSFNLLDLHPTRFDVILLDPPLKEYVQAYPKLGDDPRIANCGGPIGGERPYWTWEELECLPVPQIASSPGFIFLWCGSGQGKDLEQGRALLSKWGYRKCEDLVWIKTNHNFKDTDRVQQPLSIFRSTKEHCLMGIRGTVRRSTDGHFVHCNVDTDVMVSEPDPDDLLNKPVELYHLIENFCLGRRRIELFGSSKSLRPGWLTVGKDCMPGKDLEIESLPPSQKPVPYSKTEYQTHFLDSAGRTHTLLPFSDEINSLRPRSPPGRIAPTVPGSPLPRGLGAGYPGGAAQIPIVGPDGTVVATSISGRNTVSHPSGGLGRGPGNALLPGMRVSGFRDSNQNRNQNRHLPQSNFPAQGPNPTAFMNPASGHPASLGGAQAQMAYHQITPGPNPMVPMTNWQGQQGRMVYPQTQLPPNYQNQPGTHSPAIYQSPAGLPQSLPINHSNNNSHLIRQPTSRHFSPQPSYHQHGAPLPPSYPGSPYYHPLQQQQAPQPPPQGLPLTHASSPHVINDPQSNQRNPNEFNHHSSHPHQAYNWSFNSSQQQHQQTHHHHQQQQQQQQQQYYYSSSSSNNNNSNSNNNNS